MIAATSAIAPARPMASCSAAMRSSERLLRADGLFSVRTQAAPRCSSISSAELWRVSCGPEASIRDFPSHPDTSVQAKLHSRVDIRLHFLHHGHVLRRRLARELIADIL